MTAPDPRLDAIKDRLGAATPGPWRAYAACIRQDREWRDASEIVVDYLGDRPTIPNALFIANAPADVAHLLSVVEAQAGQIAKAGALISALIEHDDCQFDHHGGCQAHGFHISPGQTCPQQDAKNWTAALAPEGPEA